MGRGGQRSRRGGGEGELEVGEERKGEDDAVRLRRVRGRAGPDEIAGEEQGRGRACPSGSGWRHAPKLGCLESRSPLAASATGRTRQSQQVSGRDERERANAPGRPSSCSGRRHRAQSASPRRTARRGSPTRAQGRKGRPTSRAPPARPCPGLPRARPAAPLLDDDDASAEPTKVRTRSPDPRLVQHALDRARSPPSLVPMSRVERQPVKRSPPKTPPWDRQACGAVHSPKPQGSCSSVARRRRSCEPSSKRGGEDDGGRRSGPAMKRGRCLRLARGHARCCC